MTFLSVSWPPLLMPCSLSLNPHHTPCLHPPLLSICCWRAHCPRFFHALSPTCCPGTCYHWSPGPGLLLWRSSQSPCSLQVIIVTTQEHLPGAKPVPDVYIQYLLESLRLSGDVETSPRDFSGLVTDSRAGELREGMQTLV